MHLHDLVRTEGEPRWTAVVDALLAVAVVAWVLVLSILEPGATLRFGVPFVLATVVVGRVLLLVEHTQRWREEGPAETAEPAASTDAADVAHAA